MEAIKTINLSKKYRDTVAVSNLNLSVEEGSLVSLLGLNGAGKTTTVKMLSCILKPTEGDAYIFGKSILNSANDVKEIIGVSPQESAVAHGLSVIENLNFIAGIYKIPKEKAKIKIDEIIENFDLKKVLNKKAGKLSGGWIRRLSIAMSLISEPKILFLDEPTLGLDVLARSELWNKIKALKGKITVVMTTHYMEEAEALSDKVAIMKDGELICYDTVSKIKEKSGADNFEEAFIKIIKEAK